MNRISTPNNPPPISPDFFRRALSPKSPDVDAEDPYNPFSVSLADLSLGTRVSAGSSVPVMIAVKSEFESEAKNVEVARTSPNKLSPQVNRGVQGLLANAGKIHWALGDAVSHMKCAFQDLQVIGFFVDTDPERAGKALAITSVELRRRGAEAQLAHTRALLSGDELAAFDRKVPDVNGPFDYPPHTSLPAKPGAGPISSGPYLDALAETRMPIAPPVPSTAEKRRIRPLQSTTPHANPFASRRAELSVFHSKTPGAPSAILLEVNENESAESSKVMVASSTPNELSPHENQCVFAIMGSAGHTHEALRVSSEFLQEKAEKMEKLARIVETEPETVKAALLVALKDIHRQAAESALAHERALLNGKALASFDQMYPDVNGPFEKPDVVIASPRASAAHDGAAKPVDHGRAFKALQSIKDVGPKHS